ncbi:SDR family NAD(P)-dependent oxidoreductase [Halomonas aquamarina]|uniref:SDR family NAD(P)-dependent oxidoreductase n=1 Tax=Vreelandella aquamarina TaxID=77097 RepID=A0ACC5VWJ5_9GAMM|nr:SDR family NAD(P)-dependent oxidoreductase [Halomonas aquamarina]MBZ5488528.1 SDR family NAD(P)-dependent oxidoreductase [Halomonas aquamarina]
MLDTLPERFTAVITGASGGIGHAILKKLLSSSHVGRVVTVTRQALAVDDERVVPLTLDVTTAEGRQALKTELAGQPVHLFFNALGLLHDDAQALQPEKRLDQLSDEHLQAVMQVNAFTPALLVAVLADNFKGAHPCVIASLSARVGSISDNRLGGWYSYRASKAAHNMLLKTAAIELKRLNPQSVVLCLHPGTTDTSLSKPFQARVPSEKLFTPEFVADQLLEVISQRTPDDTGSFWDWAGKPVEW